MASKLKKTSMDASTNCVIKVTFPSAFPAIYRLVTLDGNAVVFVLQAVADNGSKLLHYILEYYQGQQQKPVYSEGFKGLKKEFKLTKLQPSQRYTFRLAAVNDCGKGYAQCTTIFSNVYYCIAECSCVLVHVF